VIIRYLDKKSNDEQGGPHDRRGRQVPEDLGPVDREAVEQGVGRQGEEDPDVPSPPADGLAGMKAQDQAHQQGGEKRHDEKRMAGPAVVGEILDGVAQGHENVQVRPQAAQPAPRPSTASPTAAPSSICVTVSMRHVPSTPGRPPAGSFRFAARSLFTIKNQSMTGA
jgi:hypothetical protein